MPDYLVEWSIDIEDAEDAQDAAVQAWECLQADGSIASAFTVNDVTGHVVAVDLHEGTVGEPVWAPQPRQVADLAQWMHDQDWPVSEIIRMLRGPHKYASEYTAMIVEAAFATVAKEPELDDVSDETP